MDNGFELRARCSKRLYDLVEKYALAHGLTNAAAIRDLTYKQVHYWAWQSQKERDWSSKEEWLRGQAKAILKKNPDCTEAQLAWNLVRRTGRFVDRAMVERVAAEFFA